MARLAFCVTRQDNPGKSIMGESFGGHSFSANARYLERDGRPWLPVMAEFHHSRYAREEWEVELRKIKACGVDIIATYLFWIHHEEKEGVFDFSGSRDIGYFLRLCRDLGLFALVRIGPWCHGECRNGGFPDWLQESGLPLRGCDERYLALVRRLYAAYTGEMAPWLFGNGGPVIGVQLENELTENAPYLAELKKIAVECGICVPFYTVTGWGAHVTEFPEGEVLPVFGGYPAAPWTDHCDPLPPSGNYFFTPFRNDSEIGSDQISGRKSREEGVLQEQPFLTCELGPGVQCTYHRRPVIAPMDVAALSLTKLGSGNNLPGYYVFHGGFNPAGGLYQESKVTGYPNDLPVSSYDFQAPLGEYGQVRPSYFLFKRLHQFIKCCGEDLAAMGAFFPDVMPADREDRVTPRLALRSDGRGGYLFFNTHQRGYCLEPVKDLEVAVRYASGEERLYGPMNLPAGTCGVFPLERQWFGVTVSFMTMQPLWAGVLDGAETLVCTALDGVEPWLALRGKWAVERPAAYRICQEEGVTTVQGLRPGRDCAVDIKNEEAALRIMVLGEKDGLQFYPPVGAGDGDAMIFSEGIVFEKDGKAVAYEEAGSLDAGRGQAFQIHVSESEEHRITSENPYAAFLFTLPGACPEYRLEVSGKLPDGLYDAFIRFDVQADVVQLYAGQQLIADEFIRGEPWMVSFRRIRPYLAQGLELRLKCAPLGPEKRVYLERPVARGTAEVKLLDVVGVRIRPING